METHLLPIILGSITSSMYLTHHKILTQVHIILHSMFLHAVRDILAKMTAQDVRQIIIA